jgi:aspartate racemase
MTHLAGIVGGIGPEATVDYYRSIINLYETKVPGGHQPRVIINSIDMKIMLDLVTANRLAELTDFLAAEIQRLADAGAEFGALSSNTPHLVFDQLRESSSIPLISIVETVCNEAQSSGMKRLGLIGTRFTMQAAFYRTVFSRAGMEIVTPTEAKQNYIHSVYMDELIKGIFKDETRQRLLEIADEMKSDSNIEGLILGGTELPLILTGDVASAVPLIDTTGVHVSAIVARMMA